MNKVILIGRLTADPELRYTPSGVPTCSFRLAVDRPFTSQNGEREADFINIVVWRAQAENVAKYMSKGRQVAVEGRLQVRTYDDKDGRRQWISEVVANNVEFLGSGNSSSSGNYGGNNYGGQPQNNYQRQNEPFSQPAASADNGLGSFGTEVSFSDEDLPF